MFILKVYVIYSPNNIDNIFLNKNINRLLIDIFNSKYSVEYTDDFGEPNVILFAEKVKLIREFIDTNNLKYRKCVAITQEVYHETTEDTYEEYNTNQIYIYNCFNNKFYLNNFYNFYGIPGGKIDISNKKKENYSNELYFFGNIWRQNWEQKCSLYKKRTEAAVYGYKDKLISKIFSRDFYGISLTTVESKNMELEKSIIEIQENVIKNVSREEKNIIIQKLFYSIEFLPTDYTNFTGERPFDAIISGCVPIFMGTSTLKKVFPIDSIIYVDEFSTINECFSYVKGLSYDEWKIRIDKCIDIILKLAPEGNNGDNLIFQIFKNIVDDLFKDLPLFDVYLFASGKCGGTTLCNSFNINNITTSHIHSKYGGGGYNTNINNKFIYETIMYSSINKEIIILDIYRTPIERRVSSFFEANYINHKTNTLEELCNIFNDNYLFQIENYYSMNEILEDLHLPLFNNFDFEKKYNILKKDNLTFIYLLFENFDEFPKIIKTITKYDIDIHELNCSWQKFYIETYTEFKKIFKCNINFLPKLLSDKQFNIYVKEKDKENYLKKHFNLTSNLNSYFNYYKLEDNNRNDFMINLFNSNTPFFLNTHGGTDFVCCETYFNSENIKTAFELYGEKVKEYCGYFDKSDDQDIKLENFKIYLNKINLSLQNSFITTTCVKEYTKNNWTTSILNNKIVLSYSYIENVMPFLNDFKIFAQNKKILIISPFSKTIEIQYKKKDFLIDKYKYPDFELLTYDIPITYNINDNPYLLDVNFNNWNELVENMCEEINKINFDIALISAGSYSYSLGDFISSNMKKKAVYIGGILNVLFAIRSNRYHVEGSGYELINPSNSIIESC